MDIKTKRMWKNLEEIGYSQIKGEFYCPKCTDISERISPLSALRHEDIDRVKTSVGIEQYGYTDFGCTECNSVYRVVGTISKRFLVKRLPVLLSDYEKLR